MIQFWLFRSNNFLTSCFLKATKKPKKCKKTFIFLWSSTYGQLSGEIMKKRPDNYAKIIKETVNKADRHPNTQWIFLFFELREMIYKSALRGKHFYELSAVASGARMQVEGSCEWSTYANGASMQVQRSCEWSALAWSAYTSGVL